MNKSFLVLLLALTSVACNSDDQLEIENAVRDKLNDPASAQFKKLVISEFGNRACVAWNSKNQLGGYGDWKFAELKNEGSMWVVSEIEQDPRFCTSELFKLRDESIKLGDEFLNLDGVPEELRVNIQKTRNLAYDNENLLREKIDLLKEYINERKNIAVNRNNGNQKVMVTEYKVRHILVRTEGEAKKIIAELGQGTDFAKLANENSLDAKESQNGGDLGWFPVTQMVASFSEAVAELKTGKYTKEPVKTQFGFHVILKEDTRAVLTQP